MGTYEKGVQHASVSYQNGLPEWLNSKTKERIQYCTEIESYARGVSAGTVRFSIRRRLVLDAVGSDIESYAGQ